MVVMVVSFCTESFHVDSYTASMDRDGQPIAARGLTFWRSFVLGGHDWADGREIRADNLDPKNTKVAPADHTTKTASRIERRIE